MTSGVINQIQPVIDRKIKTYINKKVQPITQNNFDYLLKYVIVGVSTVGKSNLLLRYIQNQFEPQYYLTFGNEFKAKNIQIDNRIFRLQIWDTSGPENFHSLTMSYFKNSVCVLIVYDITSRETFEKASHWIEDFKSQSPKTISMILVGNKCDLNDKRQVTIEEGRHLAENNEMLFFETSAKNGKNVEEMFLYSTQEISKKINQGYYDLDNEACGIKKGKASNINPKKNSKMNNNISFDKNQNDEINKLKAKIELLEKNKSRIL